MRQTLSVAIISYNEEARIPACLAAVRPIADEIVVVDSGSTDRTPELADSVGARVFTEPWQGFVAQKNSALVKCTSDWVLFLDCDEVLSIELQHEVSAAIQSDAYQGYYVQSAPFFMGRRIRYSWGGEHKLRLIRRNCGAWTGLDVHETLECRGAIGELRGVFYHHTYLDFTRQLAKSSSYSKLGATSLIAKGKKVRLHHLLANPVWSFIKPYIVKRGFLDGFQGFVIAVLAARNTFDKYMMAWELQNEKRLENKSERDGRL
jgi:glycosyltransferase involved in cell wall biosynthesis